jgi:hypothetical protein
MTNAPNAPIVGSWPVDVKAVRPFRVHGDLYFELHVLRLGDDDEAMAGSGSRWRYGFRGTRRCGAESG